VDKEAIQTELTETKLELSNTKLQFADANLKLENATLEIERLKQELQRKEESTNSSENILLNQETGLNIYDCIQNTSPKRGLFFTPKVLLFYTKNFAFFRPIFFTPNFEI